jgi:hypothetical protein
LLLVELFFGLEHKVSNSDVFRSRKEAFVVKYNPKRLNL